MSCEFVGQVLIRQTYDAVLSQRTKGQEVLYDMFDLPLLSMEKKNGRQLLMIGVSNMLNLPDKLHPRVQSRIGSARVFFRSYSVDETKAILLSKVKSASPNYEVFHSDAILYASKKTAAMSGDIRKAFQMCKQAAELVREDALKSNENKRMVFIKDVLRVSRDSFNSAQSRIIGLCTSLEALLIVTLASLSKTTGREFGGFDVEELVTKMDSIAHSQGDPQYLPPPTLEETLVMLRSLDAANMVTLDSPQNASLSYRASLAGSGGAWPLVSLPVDDVAVLVALKDTSHHRLAQKHLGRQ
jgi:AAA lid domain